MSRDLYGRFFEAAVFPLLDRLNGTRIASRLAELEAGERIDLAEIRVRQTAKLERTLERARAGSDFYRRHWRGGGGPHSEHPALDGLPLVTKADLAAAAAAGAFPLHGHGRLIESRTSGSTGSPMTFYRTGEQESWFWALRFRIWGWGGYRPGDPYLTINLNPRTAPRKRLQDLLFRCAYLTFNADDLEARTIVDTLARRRIPHLNGFSSSLYALARAMLRDGVGNPGVTGVTATGDALFPAYREAVEQAFGVRVLDYYGAGGEGVHLASQCLESGGRYHLHPENAVTELLGSDGPAAPGETGRVVVTQLDNDAMPLIRYDLEDAAVPAPPGAACPCGRTLPLIERIEGRVPDLVVLDDGSFLVTHFFVVLFKNLQSVHRYQVLQRTADRIVVRLVARPGCDRPAVETEVGRRVAAATRGRLAVGFEWVDEIPLTGAGKRRLVISEVGGGAAATAAANAGAEDRGERVAG